MANRNPTKKHLGRTPAAVNGSRRRAVKSSKDPGKNLRRQLRNRIDSLSDDRLQVADDFLAFLEERESQAATEELLAIPGFLKSLRAAESEVRKGKTVDWRTLRRDV